VRLQLIVPDLHLPSVMLEHHQFDGRKPLRINTDAQRGGLWRGQSLRPATRPQGPLHFVRGHWAIENKVHHVRDVTLDEDRSQIRKGHGPQVMATLRNLALSLLRLAGASNTAQATLYLSRRLKDTPRLLGIP
jgi:hypothetical protein